VRALGAVLAVGLLVAIAWWLIDRENTTREDKLQTACEHAAQLRSRHLVDQSHDALAVVRRADKDHQCQDVDAAGLRRLQRERAEAFERARALRRATRVARRNIDDRQRKRWRLAALEAYLAGLAIDPASPGARSGLRAALRATRERGSRAADRHCARAWRLLSLRLVREARAEYVRAVAAGAEERCSVLATTLRAERRSAYGYLRSAESLERAGDLDGARQSYLAVTALDPGMPAALEGLRSSRPTIPAPIDWPAVMRNAPAYAAGVALAALIIVPSLLVIWFAVIVRLLRHLGKFPPVGWWGWANRLHQERVLITLEDKPSYLQRQAIDVAIDELRKPEPREAGFTAPLLARSPLPTEFAPSGAGPLGPQSDLATAVPLFGRLTAFVRLFRPLAGLPWRHVSIEPVPDDGFRVGDVVRKGAAPVKGQLPVDVQPPDPRTRDSLGVGLAAGIRRQRGQPDD
jgi:hypothetical protein